MSYASDMKKELTLIEITKNREFFIRVVSTDKNEWCLKYF